MKKRITPRMAVIALLILTFISTGSLAIKQIVGPSGGGSTGGWDDDMDGSGG